MAPYDTYLDAAHQLCCAHALRELAGVTDTVSSTAFLVAQSGQLAPKTTQRLATVLRSLLRFWHVEGLIPGPLAQSVPKVANRRAALPRPLEPEQVAAMLSGCERDSRAGQRDLAILTLLARMDFARARSPVCNSTTSTGDAQRSPYGARAAAVTGFRSRSMWVRPSRATCATADPLPPWTAACSSGSKRHTGV